MIPCFICGVIADTGWVEGFPPAPDSQKLALCKLHDTPENREIVQEEWVKKLQHEIHVEVKKNAFKSGERLPSVLTIFFTGGGSLSIPCVEYSETEYNTLQVRTPKGESVFYPLQQVRSYSIHTDRTLLEEASSLSSGHMLK